MRALEEKGIGRPSTYAPTISTIITRGYVARENKRLIPTELGKIVNDHDVQKLPGHRGHRRSPPTWKKSWTSVETGEVGMARHYRATSTARLRKTLEKAEASHRKGLHRGPGLRRRLRKVWRDDGLQDEPLRPVPGLPQLPRLPPHAWRCPQEHRRDLSRSAARELAGARQPQGPQVLRLRALSGVRFRLLGSPGERQMSPSAARCMVLQARREGHAVTTCASNETCRHRVRGGESGGSDGE